MAEAPEKKVRIDTGTGTAIVSFALGVDALQFFISFLHVIPWAGNAIATVVNIYLAFCASFVLGLWFKFKGVDYFQGRKAAMKLLAVFGALVVEIIPIIDALPALTASAVTMIIASRIEDTLGDAKALVRRGQQQQEALQAASSEQERKKILAQQAVERRRMQLAVASGDTEATLPEAEKEQDPLLNELKQYNERAKRPVETMEAKDYGKTTPKQVADYEKWRAKKAEAMRRVRYGGDDKEGGDSSDPLSKQAA